MRQATWWAASALTLLAPLRLAARQISPPPTIDTVIVVTENVFSQTEARSNSVFAFANALRFKTRPYVVRRELLFHAGEPFDLVSAAETARNLRTLGLFRFVGIDTTRTPDGRFAVVVRTRDGWSTQIQLNAASTGGTFTWAAGLTEINFLGTGDLVSVIYRKGVDRNSVTIGFRTNRLAGTRLLATGAYQSFSDGQGGSWLTGLPFRAFGDRLSIQYFGEAADRRVLQYRVNAVDRVDTTRYRRTAFRNGAVAAIAPVAEGRRYLRVGVSAEVRREEFVLEQDTGLAAPDTVRGLVGAFAEFRRANFQVVTYFNGFGLQEDLDLSTSVRASVRLAPTAFGYDRTGVGPDLTVSSGVPFPGGYVRGSVNIHGLFTAAGLDSGQVVARMTVGAQLLPRNATFLHVVAGAQERPVPGREFDLGHGIGPRSFGPHAFVGTRMLWGTLEHRWFTWDDLGGVLGLGFAGFLDYGGSWYPDQPSRFGGNVGLGLRTGFNRSTGANTGRIDIGYRFGEGFANRRWVLSFGRGFLF